MNIIPFRNEFDHFPVTNLIDIFIVQFRQSLQCRDASISLFHLGQIFYTRILVNPISESYNKLQFLSLAIGIFISTISFAQEQVTVARDTIPFTLSDYNNIIVKAVINDIDTLNLKFDSGTTGLLLTNNAIDNKLHWTRNSNHDNSLKIGNMEWDSLRIYPVELSGQGTDGRFGWDLFNGKVVEIDFDNSLFIVHSKPPPIDKEYARFDIEYTHTLFCIEAELEVKGIIYKNRFLFDNGYQRTVMLDTVLMAEQNFPKDLEVIKKVIMRNGQGKEIPVITVNCEKIHFGNYSLADIPVQLLTTGNPARFKTHILGNEVLKRFNTFLDFQNNHVYLKPNGLFNQDYTDEK